MRPTVGRQKLASFGIAALAMLLTIAPSQQSLGKNPIESKNQIVIQPGELTDAIEAKLMSVPEFKFIRAEAERLGVRVWLFGGTAAGFAHYVKWDLLRQKGDTDFQPDRFDYDFTNIYRSTQDLDIVVDGPGEAAHELRDALASKFPHFQGSKEAWEVRLLRTGTKDKMALLDNPDFLNQHTDSNSTGMIEVTRPQKNDWAVRDLRDWDRRDNFFLEDVRLGKLHYYFSNKHETTSRFREGINPPIISVIRYLTKAFQYELELRPEDLKNIKRIIDQTDISQIYGSSGPKANHYVRNWIEKNAPKLIQNAVNIEYAWNTLEKLGLRQKLTGAGSREEDSMSWWLNKEPLRSKPIGQDTKPTAADIARKLGMNQLIVAHETNNFLAYESITRAHTGEPNVLISRQKTRGETASFGDGFYTQIGRQGAVGTGLTIRFVVDPQAREGADFIREGNYLIFLNKNAIRVIPETLNIGPVQFFKLVTSPDFLTVEEDRGIYEKLKRRIETKISDLTPWEYKRVAAIMARYALGNKPDKMNMEIVQTWFKLKIHFLSVQRLLSASDYPDILNEYEVMHSHSQKHSQVSNLILETMSDFLTSKPNVQQLLAVKRTFDSSSRNKVPSSKFYQDKFEAILVPFITRARDFKLLIDSKEVWGKNWRAFIKLKPTPNDIAQVIKSGVVDELPDAYRSFAKLARSAGEYLEMAGIPFGDLTREPELARFVEGTIDLFFKLKPTPEQASMLKYLDLPTDLLVGKLEKYARARAHTPQDFLDLFGHQEKYGNKNDQIEVAEKLASRNFEAFLASNPDFHEKAAFSTWFEEDEKEKGERMAIELGKEAKSLAELLKWFHLLETKKYLAVMNSEQLQKTFDAAYKRFLRLKPKAKDFDHLFGMQKYRFYGLLISLKTLLKQDFTGAQLLDLLSGLQLTESDFILAMKFLEKHPPIRLEEVVHFISKQSPKGHDARKAILDYAETAVKSIEQAKQLQPALTNQEASALTTWLVSKELVRLRAQDIVDLVKIGMLMDYANHLSTVLYTLSNEDIAWLAKNSMSADWRLKNEVDIENERRDRLKKKKTGSKSHPSSKTAGKSCKTRLSKLL